MAASKGALHLSETDISALVRRVGANYNAFTISDKMTVLALKTIIFRTGIHAATALRGRVD